MGGCAISLSRFDVPTKHPHQADFRGEWCLGIHSFFCRAELRDSGRALRLFGEALATGRIEYPLPAEEEQEEQTATSASTATATPPAEQPSDTAQAQPSPEDDFERALRNIANEEYEPAIAFFQSLVVRRPDYHIGWLRLGHALRELAMRKRAADGPEAADLFSRSIDALTKAAKHTHSPRQAQALYERSKAFYHRGRLPSASAANGDVVEALDDAQEAFRISPDTRYETWIAYLKQHVPSAEPGLAIGSG